MVALDILMNYLISKNLATEEDVDIFRNYIPDNPDDVLCVMEYQGRNLGHFDNVSQHSIQIFVRGLDVEQRIWNIYNQLCQDAMNLEVPDHCCEITMKHPPFKINRDNRGRFEWVFNFFMLVNN